MILRLIPALLLGLWVSALLFWLMHAMLQHHDAWLGYGPTIPVDFAKLKLAEPVTETLSRELPPPPAAENPALTPLTADSVAPPRQDQPAVTAFDLPKLALPLGGGSISAALPATGLLMPHSIPGGAALPDRFGSLLAPIVKIPPAYPMEARRRKIEGWVRVEFTVGEDGSVSEVKVNNAEPSGVFEQAAVAAISRWKFRPPRENGQPVRQRAAQTLRFELNR